MFQCPREGFEAIILLGFFSSRFSESSTKGGKASCDTAPFLGAFLSTIFDTRAASNVNENQGTNALLGALICLTFVLISTCIGLSHRAYKAGGGR